MSRVKRALGALVVSTVVAGGLSVVSPAAQAAPAAHAGSRATGRDLRDLPLPPPDQPPQLSGIPLVGEVLSVSEPVWSVLPGTLVGSDITWLCDGSPIPGTEGLWQFVPGQLQAGCLITAQVTTTFLGFVPLQMVTNALQIPGVGESAVTAAAAPTVTADKGSPKVGTTLTTSQPEWNQDGVTTAYQWLRNGEPIAGQTGRTYLLTPADLDNAISVRATGSKPNLSDGVATSNALTVVLGDAPTPTVQPTIVGTPAVGSTLTVDPGAWGAGETPAYAYQWRRDNQALPGATTSAYRPTAADIGHVLTVTVTATRPGYRPGTFRTAGATVPKVSSSLVASLPKKTVKQGRSAAIRLVLRVAGSVPPAGEVVIRDGAKTLRRAAFATGGNGALTVGLGRLRPGVHRLKAVYAGSDQVEGSTSKVVKLTVKRHKKK